MVQNHLREAQGMECKDASLSGGGTPISQDADERLNLYLFILTGEAKHHSVMATRLMHKTSGSSPLNDNAGQKTFSTLLSSVCDTLCSLRQARMASCRRRFLSTFNIVLCVIVSYAFTSGYTTVADCTCATSSPDPLSRLPRLFSTKH